MIFNSYLYFFSLVVLLAVYVGFKENVRKQNWLLLIASYSFYACWDWRFLSLILISTLTDYHVAKQICGSKSTTGKRFWLSISIFVNLGLLGFFKYFNFFVESAEQLITAIGFVADYPTLNVILPVGISFYTFQTLSYTIDVYRKKSTPTNDLLNFSLYVTFFPQLVAGPIERPSSLLPQIEKKRKITSAHIAEGMHHILIGLFKKVVVADNMALYADGVFAKGADPLNGLENWIGLIAFALQIYGDFSGYSSIAQGSAKLLGFELSYNFHMPYFAKSPSEFWTRWHVTLSQWLRDYIYIPLGGNRGGSVLTYRNLMLTMLLGGLWHGAGWHFVLWGFYHGLILCLFRLVQIRCSFERLTATRMFSVVATLFMFVLTLFGWLLFRIDNLPQIFDVAVLLCSPSCWQVTSLSVSMCCSILFMALPLFVYEYWIYRNENEHLLIFRKHWICRAGLYSYFLLMMVFFSTEASQEFIYFQF